MDFRAIQIISQAVGALVGEMTWATYGAPNLHTPVVTTEEDCHKLDLLMDMMGTLTRLMDTRVAYVTSEGKVIREWIESILEISQRYRKELELLRNLEQGRNE